jgi:hypothetical protein
MVQSVNESALQTALVVMLAVVALGLITQFLLAVARRLGKM